MYASNSVYIMCRIIQSIRCGVETAVQKEQAQHYDFKNIFCLFIMADQLYYIKMHFKNMLVCFHNRIARRSTLEKLGMATF